MYECTGSIAYKAPEMIINDPYTEMVDSWSAGCVLYMMISGKHPFPCSNVNQLKIQI